MIFIKRDIFIAGAVVLLSILGFSAAIGTLVFTSSPGNSVAMENTQEAIPILCYHYVRDETTALDFIRILGAVVLSLPLLDDDEMWSVAQRSFRQQMNYIATHGYTPITLDELDRYQRGEATQIEKPVVITFDDGDLSVYKHAFPILKEHGFKATFFVVTGRIDQEWNGRQTVSWEQLREMKNSGVFAIESHTHDLHYKVTLGSDNDRMSVFLAASQTGYQILLDEQWRNSIVNDLARSRLVLQSNLGVSSRFLAWPYGDRDDTIDELAYAAGFKRVCTLAHIPNDRVLVDSETERLPPLDRYTVTARTSLRSLREMLDGTKRADAP